MSQTEHSASELSAAERAELDFLRGRVAALERERDEQLRLATQAVAAAQQRAYWLDRWHVDLNALMARRGAAEFRAAVRLLRAVVRRLRGIKRRLVG
jgi:hypothetical protein